MGKWKWGARRGDGGDIEPNCPGALEDQYCHLLESRRNLGGGQRGGERRRCRRGNERKREKSALTLLWLHA